MQETAIIMSFRAMTASNKIEWFTFGTITRYYKKEYGQKETNFNGYLIQYDTTNLAMSKVKKCRSETSYTALWMHAVYHKEIKKGSFSK